jgi:hypothetical protein
MTIAHAHLLRIGLRLPHPGAHRLLSYIHERHVTNPLVAREAAIVIWSAIAFETSTRVLARIQASSSSIHISPKPPIAKY